MLNKMITLYRQISLSVFFLFRYTHSCAHIHSDGTGPHFSIIAAGGYEADGVFLSSVEILDSGAASWRKGPELPISIGFGAMVEDPLGDSCLN
jgi:hypothetical protein